MAKKRATKAELLRRVAEIFPLVCDCFTLREIRLIVDAKTSWGHSVCDSTLKYYSKLCRAELCAGRPLRPLRGARRRQASPGAHHRPGLGQGRAFPAAGRPEAAHRAARPGRPRPQHSQTLRRDRPAGQAQPAGREDPKGGAGRRRHARRGRRPWLKQLTARRFGPTSRPPWPSFLSRSSSASWPPAGRSPMRPAATWPALSGRSGRSSSRVAPFSPTGTSR